MDPTLMAWYGAAAASVAGAGATLGLYGKVWIDWTKVNLKGGIREVAVAEHGLFHRGFVKPNPVGYLKPTSRRRYNTVFFGPLTRITTITDMDRDELQIEIPVTFEGAPASTDSADQPVIVVRVSWSIPDFVAVIDDEADPGDHGRIPRNLWIHRTELKKLSRHVWDSFVSRHVRKFMPHPMKYFVPGPAAIAFMNDYLQGEHIARLYESVTHHVRAACGRPSVQNFIRVQDPVDGGRIDYTMVRIRNRRCEFHDNDPNDPYYVPMAFHNQGELQDVLSAILTRVCQLEVEPFGIYINELTVREIRLPPRIVAASRAREAREQDVLAMKKFVTQLTESTAEIVEANPGMNPDMALLTAANSAGSGNESAGTLAALLSAFTSALNAFGRRP